MIRKHASNGKKTVPKKAPEAATSDNDFRHPSYVVGIGASAGGIEAFSELIEALPGETGMTYIFILHLDPTHESMLSQIFQRKTAITVQEAQDGMRLEPDNLYVIPPNRYMTIIDGKLSLLSREQGSGKFMPIDLFFKTMSAWWKNRSIGVILSGTANDGTLGLKEVKGAGGLTFAQDPTNAHYPDMPESAIQSGVVDFVLTPARIAQELARVAKYPMLLPDEQDQELPSKPDADTAAIFRMLLAISGIDFSSYKPSTIHRRITRRMMVARIETLTAYINFLKKNTSEQEALANDLLINVTSFFRDPEIFETLKEKILPDLLRRKPAGSPIRVWVPGCSTGEEPYSLGICLLEVADELSLRNPIQIFATDVSDQTIERARTGIYPESITNEVSKERLNRFFIRCEGGYQISKNLRDLCIFARQDLTRDPPFSRMDLISCRNVLIYLMPALQKKILPTFHYALNHDGFLVLGSSESTGGFGNIFTLMDRRFKIYQKKAVDYRGKHEFQPPLYEERPGPGKKPAGTLTTEFDVQREADRIILGSYAPATVLINDQMDIIQFRGKTGSFIEPVSGAASLNLAKMLREGLLLAVHSLVARARKQNLPVHQRDVVMQMDGSERRVDLDVVPVRPPNVAKPRYFLVVFRESLSAVVAREEPKSDRKREQRQIEHLRHELQTTREYLQSALEEKESMNEEFRAAVEEIQSGNEELQSTNEELETAKEELQSTNEELITVNEELQTRNMELSQVNNDLLNVLNNVSLPVIMLSTDLRIRRFNPTAEKLLNLIPSDVGRPLSDLRLSTTFPDLEGQIGSVVETLEARELEVQGGGGRWFQLRLRPYLTVDRRLDGVVMSLVDISEMKQSMEHMQEQHLFMDAVFETLRESLLLLTPDLKVERANRAYYERFHTTPQETTGNYFYKLQQGQWYDPQLRRLLDEVLPEKSSFDNFIMQIGNRRVLINGRRIQGAEGAEKILIAIDEEQLS